MPWQFPQFSQPNPSHPFTFPPKNPDSFLLPNEYETMKVLRQRNASLVKAKRKPRRKVFRQFTNILCNYLFYSLFAHLAWAAMPKGAWQAIKGRLSKLCSVQKKKKIKNKTENRMNWPTEASNSKHLRMQNEGIWPKHKHPGENKGVGKMQM